MAIDPYVSINAELVSALSGTLAAAHDIYSGTAKTYGIFTVLNRLPEVIGSAKNHAVGVYVDLDVFSTDDLTGGSTVITSVVSKLNQSGFTVKGVSDIPYDGVKHHVMIEIYKRKPR